MCKPTNDLFNSKLRANDFKDEIVFKRINKAINGLTLWTKESREKISLALTSNEEQCHTQRFSGSNIEGIYWSDYISQTWTLFLSENRRQP